MEPWQIAAVLQPIVFAALVYFILAPARKLVFKMKESKLKRFLLWRIQ
jgi:hypothetical protein